MSEALIVRHCSPTLAGLKTANMFNYTYKDRTELRESIRSVNVLLKDKGIRMIPLRVSNGRALIYVKPLSPYEMFKANVEAGSDKQIIIKELIESFGLEIASGQGPGRIVAVSAIERIYDKYGYHVLSRALRLCIGAWEGDSGSFSANILTAIARLAATYEDELDDTAFVDKLGAVSLKSLARTAKERRAGSMGFAEAMVLVYNGKRKNAWSRLSMAKLYAKKNGGNRVAQINGGVKDEDRRELRERFELNKEDEDAIDILLFTEVGSEGLDYQFCDMMINYRCTFSNDRMHPFAPACVHFKKT